MPSYARRFAVALGQVREMIDEKGERVGLAEAKKHLAWYCHGMEGAAAARGRLMQSTTYEEMADILAGMAAVADSAAAESVANTEASHG
jgi:tRNA-dihydrouridine synthase